MGGEVMKEQSIIGLNRKAISHIEVGTGNFIYSHLPSDIPTLDLHDAMRKAEAEGLQLVAVRNDGRRVLLQY